MRYLILHYIISQKTHTTQRNKAPLAAIPAIPAIPIPLYSSSSDMFTESITADIHGPFLQVFDDTTVSLKCA